MIEIAAARFNHAVAAAAAAEAKAKADAAAPSVSKRLGNKAEVVAGPVVETNGEAAPRASKARKTQL